jgi:hypothetical protein
MVRVVVAASVKVVLPIFEDDSAKSAPVSEPEVIPIVVV